MATHQSAQYQLPFIPHNYQGALIEQRAKDGYINATAMCKAAGKGIGDYLRLGSTRAFMEALDRSMGNPTDPVMITVASGPNEQRGTWVHPQVAIHLAQWLSPDFAVQVSQWVFEWMSGRAPTSRNTAIPQFVKRFHLNSDAVTPGYFSVIGELFIRFYGKLEAVGYVLADKSALGQAICPDISVGKGFPVWLEDQYPSLADRHSKYPHRYPDGRVVSARQYENAALPAFIEYVETVWIPTKAAAYLADKDPAALAYLPRLLPAPLKKVS